MANIREEMSEQLVDMIAVLNSRYGNAGLSLGMYVRDLVEEVRENERQDHLKVIEEMSRKINELAVELMGG